MKDIVEQLLTEVSPEQPCGPDLSLSQRFSDLETLLKGTPDIEIGNMKQPGEPPDWRALQKQCIEYLSASKDLRPAVMLACSLLQNEGLPGFAEGLRFVRGLVEKHWAQVHPLLDREDNEDPQQRLNILGSLTLERNPGPPWLQITHYLYSAPLCQPNGAAPPTLDLVHAASKAKNAGDETPTAALTELFRTVPNAEIVANCAAVQAARDSVSAIDSFLVTTLGVKRTISFHELASVLEQIDNALIPYLNGAPEAKPKIEGPSPDKQPPEQFKAGVISNRDQAVEALEKICEYYLNHEPSSPVPYLLRRAQKMARMNFVETMLELQLVASTDQLRPSMGPVSPGGKPS